jgi:16S rRNA (uracil1498-N3)-methyltransferase
MKQSLQLHKPTINELVSFEEFTRSCKSDNKFIAHCKESEKLFLNNCKLKAKTTTVLIGPEGGFSKNEIGLAEKHGFISVSLGNNRLRTETAAIAATQILSAYNVDI